jgi:hypothetical protein
MYANFERLYLELAIAENILETVNPIMCHHATQKWRAERCKLHNLVEDWQWGYHGAWCSFL